MDKYRMYRTIWVWYTLERTGIRTTILGLVKKIGSIIALISLQSLSPYQWQSQGRKEGNQTGHIPPRRVSHHLPLDDEVKGVASPEYGFLGLLVSEGESVLATDAYDGVPSLQPRVRCHRPAVHLQQQQKHYNYMTTIYFNLLLYLVLVHLTWKERFKELIKWQDWIISILSVSIMSVRLDQNLTLFRTYIKKMPLVGWNSASMVYTQAWYLNDVDSFIESLVL